MNSANILAADDVSRFSGKQWGIIFGLAISLIGLLLYPDVLHEIFLRVVQREDASHGVCAPFISVYIIWLRLGRIKATQIHFDFFSGGMLVLVGLLVFCLAPDRGEVFLAGASFLMVVAGLVWGVFGREVIKQVGFPLLFLAAMIPLPAGVYDQLTQWIRMATTSGSVWLVKSLGLTIYREGFNVYLPNLHLFVADSCSGIRYLIPYFVFGLAYAAVCKKTVQGRFLVVLATIPLVVIGGILRQSVIFFSVYYISPVMASHRPHVVIS
jgi:exosortase